MQKEAGNNNGGNGMDGSSGDNVVQLAGRAFKKVELGLDEKDVRSCIEELINERDSLLKRQSHLSALATLAEKTVIEANNLAQQTKQKAEEQARSETERIKAKAKQDADHLLQEKKAEADRIRVKAEQDAARIVEEKKAEARVAAEKEAETIKTQAQKQVDAMRAEKMRTMKTETKNMVEKLQDELITSIENIRRQVMTLGANLDQISYMPEFETVTKPVAVAEKQTQATPKAEKGPSFDQIPWLEIEVLPPVDIGKIMDLIARLEDLPVVKTTDLLPEMPNPLIRVFLNEPSPLAELLRTLPQVKQVTEVDSTDLNTDVPNENRKERIQVVIGDNSKQEKDAKKNTAQTVSK